MSIFLVERFYDQVREVEYLKEFEDRAQFESRLAAIQFMVERAENNLAESERLTKKTRARVSKLKKALAEARAQGTKEAE